MGNLDMRLTMQHEMRSARQGYQTRKNEKNFQEEIAKKSFQTTKHCLADHRLHSFLLQRKSKSQAKSATMHRLRLAQRLLVGLFWHRQHNGNRLQPVTSIVIRHTRKQQRSRRRRPQEPG